MWEQILSTVEEVNNFLNGIVWGWPVVILILGTGRKDKIPAGAQVRRIAEHNHSPHSQELRQKTREGQPRQVGISVRGVLNSNFGHSRHGKHSRRCFGYSHWRSGRCFLDVDLGVLRHGHKLLRERTRSVLPQEGQ